MYFITKKVKVLLSFTLIFLLILTFSTPFFIKSSVVADEGYETTFKTNYDIWIASDLHAIRQTPALSWSADIGDLKNKYDYAFFLGDATDWRETPPDVSVQWDGFKNNTGQANSWNTVITNTTFANATIGNHDGGWGIYLKGQALGWTYTIGNILFIGIGDNFSYPYNFTFPPVSSAGYYMHCFDWVNQTIQNNQDKNIIILCHYPLSNTTYYSGCNGSLPVYAMENDNDSSYRGMLNWLESNGYHVDAWIHGHTHITASQWNMVQKYGTLHIADLAISPTGKGTMDSIMLNLTNNSKQVIVKGYAHDTNSWYSTAYFPYYFNLTYPFGELSLVPQFISIDNGVNGTILYNSTPTFKWTVVSNSVQYWLQISTDSSFTSLIVNLTNISAATYPSYFTETTINITFILPSTYMLPTYNTYYCRIKSEG